MPRLALAFCLIFLAACARPTLEEAPEPIGDFRLGFLVPVASPNLTKGPASREATAEEWDAAMEAAFRPRLERYEGGKFYHLGVITEGYVLAQPGIPIVLSPKSALIFSITVIDDATETRLTEEPVQFTVVESFNAASVFGSGYVMSREAQMKNLAENAAVQAEEWLREQPWFTAVEPAPEDAETPVQ